MGGIDDRNVPLLVTPFTLSSHPPLSTLEEDAIASIEIKLSLVLDSEGDLRELSKWLEEVEGLDRKGVAGAGDLAGRYMLPPPPFFVSFFPDSFILFGFMTTLMDFIRTTQKKPTANIVLNYQPCSLHKRNLPARSFR